MRIQDLAIIFIIIILPISIILGAYTQMQISTISLQTEYDMKLTAATSDAIKAFQINTANSSTSDIANSKIRDIEASVSTFKASIKSVFGMNGYSEDEMNEYIPALVYTMYDGFYIYSRFNNQNYLYKTKKDNDGNVEFELDENGNKIPIDKNGQNIFGLKPYITYSAEYVKNNIDVVITYSLDNYITIQGTVNGEYVNRDGYLVTSSGYSVLNSNNQPIYVGNSSVSVDTNNNIVLSSGAVHRFNIVDFQDYNSLNKVGSNLYTGEGATATNNYTVKNMQIEGSNVDIIQSTADLMSNLRAFEANQKVVQIMDSTLSKIANEIGTVR